MENYLEVLRIAIITFPFIALLISMPIILIQYHKYGAISFFKALIIYSFTLYFICAYFLVVLPLPKIDEVALLTTPRVQLIPFNFIVDFIKHTSLDITNIHTYLIAIKESYFFVPIYNIFLTLPFGIYLRYYFKCNLKKIIFYTFLLSLFFELTQLSGLYFIYPRGYRLFDVDDLMLNTLGGIVGYLISIPVIKILPKIEKVETKARERGKVISGFRRTTSLFLDLFLFLIMENVLEYTIPAIFKNYHIFGLNIMIYYFLIPTFLNCSTLGQKFLNIQVLDDNDRKNIFRLFFRNALFILIYIGIPIIGIFLINNVTNNLKDYIEIIFALLIFIIYAITAIKYLFTNKKMLYEKISKTKLVSTIK